MILHIDDNKSIADLQEKFSGWFPSLKVEFYDEAHHYKEPSSPNHLISPQSKIGSIRKIHEPGDFVLMSWHTTGSVEKTFREKFGLNVQIFRYENGAWIQTSATDICKLSDQSNMAQDANDRSIFNKYRKQWDEYDDL